VRRRSMTNGNGGPETPSSGLPLDGGGPVGPLAVGQGRGGPGSGGPAGQVGLPVPVSRRDLSTADKPAVTVRKGSSWRPSNWRVRWRLIAIIVVPTVFALILGVIQIVGSVDNYQSYNRVQTLANLNTLVVQGTALLADERDDTAGYVAAGGQSNSAMSAPLKAAVTADRNATTTVMNEISQQATAVTDGDGYRAQTVEDLSNGVLAGIADLAYIRQAATTTKSPALSVITNYDRLIQAFITFSNDVGAGTGNATLQSNVSVLNALLRMEDDASLQRAYLYQALASATPALTPVALADLNQAAAQQQADTNQFAAVASVAQQQTLNNTVAGPQVDEAKSAEKLAIATAGTAKLEIGAPQTCVGQSNAQCWRVTQTAQITDMRTVSNQLVGQINDQADSLAQTSLRNAVIDSVAVLLLLLLVLLITTLVARSMIRPLRRLRTDALDIAGSKLPAMVRRLSESEGGDASAEIEPIGVTSTDEFGEVARAFDQVHREAVRLAADEAMLRGNLNAMFVNLSRRSQSLIERQLSLIDSLEQTEQDADRLSSLFRLDHLATRMRRNSENLLVLAGHEAASRRWSQPVPLVDVLRAAISEIEQYERVVLNVQSGIQVVGQAVNDVVHLVAEIVENATTFSPEDTQVFVTGQPLSSGGVLLDITDNGVGISEQEMAHANWRLDNPPVVDVAVSRRMGLFVVGRLAARHGVRVRLRHAQSGGLTALIWLPDSVASPETGQPLGRLRKFETEDFGPAPSLSAPTAVGPAAPAFSGPAPLPSGLGGAELGGAAATASRTPRLSAGPGGNGVGANGPGANGPGANGDNGPAGNGIGGFSAFGGGVGSGGVGNGRPVRNGLNGPGGTLDAPGGRLPVRTPGANPLGPVNASNGPGNGAFSDDGFANAGFGSGDDFAAAAMPALGGDGGPTTGPFPTVSPGAPSGPVTGAGGSDGSKVTIPPSVSAPTDQRLPIFDSLESDWFRRSGSTLSSGAATAAGQSWNSPADEGWRAARVVAFPEAGETTNAGLPKRVPRANLVPGSVGGGEDMETAPPARSAETIRSRMASFQRGVREARAAAPQDEEP
jgi:signal transduction histidine kinase